MVNIYYSQEFKKQVKRLVKKYRSLPDDLEALESELALNPFAGVDLGNGVRKVRLAVKSKGKGKSGGARVITYLIAAFGDEIDISLLTIYDKSEKSSISDAEIKALLSFLEA